MALTLGDLVPDLLGIDEAGQEVRLSDYPGRKIILYFYPKDNTSGCTAQSCSLRDGYSELRAAGYEIIGVSRDSAKSHVGFRSKYELPFRLIADTDVQLNELFGARQGILGVQNTVLHTHIILRSRTKRLFSH